MILAAAILAMTISSPVCSAPCSVKIVVKIENASERDRCEVTIEGPDEFHATEIMVQSNRRTYELKSVIVHYSGEYTVRATLVRPVDHRYDATRTLVVTGFK